MEQETAQKFLGAGFIFNKGFFGKPYARGSSDQEIKLVWR